MTGDESELRRALVEAARHAERRGLNHNSTGNLSVRCGSGILVTPSGVPADRLGDDDIVLVDATGRPALTDGPTPTSELLLHVAVYATRPDVGAIVHTHSPEATAVACTGRAVEALHYVIARTGGSELRCAPYATYGSAELAAAVSATLGEDRMACLMSNHGAIALGATLDSALSLAHDIEWLCQVTRRAHSWGSPLVLPDAEIDRVAEMFRTYGQPPAAAP